MSRYCELKLIDVLKPEMSTKRSKTATDLKNFLPKSRITKTKLGNLSLLKNKTDSSYDVNHDTDPEESRQTRLIKKSNNSTKSNILTQDQNISVGDVAKINEPKPEITSGKRRRIDSKIRNKEEPSSKKICSTENSHLVSSRNIPSSNPDQNISQRRKRKRKSRESFWENKLTGARRVSKRLSNLKIRKSLKNLGISADAPNASFSARGKIKAKGELYEKLRKKFKTSYKKNRQEVQINFGKLSHTVRLYPKIVTGRNRRPSTYAVTIKPTGSIKQNSGKKYTCDEHFVGENTDEESSDSEVNSPTNMCMEDIQDVTVSEDKDKQFNSRGIEFKENDKSNDELQSTETTEGTIVGAITRENNVQTSFCSSVEEVTDSSTIVIVNIESGENIEFRTSSENQQSEQNIDPQKIYEEQETAEKLSNVDKLTEDVHEGIKVISFNPAKSEEKNNVDKSNCSNTNVSETNSKGETEGQESTTSGSSNELLASETIDITNTGDEVEK